MPRTTSTPSLSFALARNEARALGGGVESFMPAKLEGSGYRPRRLPQGAVSTATRPTFQPTSCARASKALLASWTPPSWFDSSFARQSVSYEISSALGAFAA